MQQPVNIRIDERLIHGQVAALWSKALSLNRIILIDGEVINNQMQKVLQRTACPDSIKLSIISPVKAAENFKINKYDGERCMVIVRWPEVLRELADFGIYFDEVVVGNMPNKAKTKMITNQIFVNENQVDIFKDLSKKTQFFVQLVPNSQKENFIRILEDIK